MKIEKLIKNSKKRMYMRIACACGVVKSPDADRSRAPSVLDQVCMSHVALRTKARREAGEKRLRRSVSAAKGILFALLSKFPLAGGIYPPMTLRFAIVRTATGITSERIFRAPRKPGCYITNDGITAGDGGQCREIPRYPSVLRPVTVP